VATDLLAVATKLHELYIVNEHNYLEQYKDNNGESAYRTVKTYGKEKNNLTPQKLLEHVKQEKTFGVKASKEGLTSFISFDVDTKENSIRDTLELAELLERWYGIPGDYIHISNSGNKGYHVELFFDRAVEIEKLEIFYLDVLNQLDKTKKEIEFRPTNQGVKIPISVHRANMQFCSYSFIQYNYNELKDFNQEDSFRYLLNIDTINFNDFDELILADIEAEVFEIEKQSAREFNQVTESLNTSGRLEGDEFNYFSKIAKKQRLIYPDTRNSVSWKLPIFWKEQGLGLEKATELTLNVILNTYDNYPGYIDKENTDRKKAISEVERLAKQAYKEDYTITDFKREVTVAKSEIDVILDIKKLHLKKLMLSFLIQSKRYADTEGVFFTAYSTLTKMGNTSERGRLKKYAYDLKKEGLLEIVSSGVVDKLRSRVENKKLMKTNQYKVLIPKPNEREKTITVANNDIPTLEEFIAQFYTIQEARVKLPRGQFERVREYYEVA